MKAKRNTFTFTTEPITEEQRIAGEAWRAEYLRKFNERKAERTEAILQERSYRQPLILCER